jgi:hypothetical protein
MPLISVLVGETASPRPWIGTSEPSGDPAGECDMPLMLPSAPPPRKCGVRISYAERRRLSWWPPPLLPPPLPLLRALRLPGDAKPGLCNPNDAAPPLNRRVGMPVCGRSAGALCALERL